MTKQGGPTTPPERVDWQALLEHPNVRAIVDLAICEDLGSAPGARGHGGDVTSEAVFPHAQSVRARIVARHDTVACGVALAQHLFRRFDAGMAFPAAAAEGESVASLAVLLELVGDVRAVLGAERCVLNFMMRLCGIAQAAREAAAALPAGCRARVYDTRKTTPGLRRLEKAAVAVGGAFNHRMGLYDAVLIKDNHIAAAGSVAAAVARARQHVGTKMPVEVEVDSLQQLEEAIAAGPDIVLLDNFDVPALREAVRRTAGRVELEASGGVTLARLPDIARTGVDRISMGSLTHSAQPADLSLEILP